MSILFKILDSSFLLTFGIILLLCGSILLYCYRRLNLLERTVIEHGKILQNFIINYNVQMQTLNTIYNRNNEMKVEKTQIDKAKTINLDDKIYVSEESADEDDTTDNDPTDKRMKSNTFDDDDDEDDEDEDDDDDEDDDEDDDDEDDDDDERIKIIDTNSSKMNVSNTHENDDMLLTISKTDLESEIKALGDFEEINLNKPVFLTRDEETFINNLPINLDTFNIDLNNKSKIINLENIGSSNNPNNPNNVENNDISNDNTNDNINSNRKNYSKMKIDDLKTLAVTRNYLDNETAQKMKKADLVKILQAQN